MELLQPLPYAVRLSDHASVVMDKAPESVLAKIAGINNTLARDPYDEELGLIPASDDGRSWIYRAQDSDIQVTFGVDNDQRVLTVYHIAVPRLPAGRLVFISYAHSDKEWLIRLKPFIRTLERAGLVEFWDDSKIVSGTEWREKIEDALENAGASLLLVSQEFLDSKFINEVELPALLDAASERGIPVFWVHVSPSTVFDDLPQITKYKSVIDDPVNITLEDLEGATLKRAMVGLAGELRQALRPTS